MTRKELVKEIVDLSCMAYSYEGNIAYSTYRKTLNKLIKEFANECYMDGYHDHKDDNRKSFIKMSQRRAIGKKKICPSCAGDYYHYEDCAIGAHGVII